MTEKEKLISVISEIQDFGIITLCNRSEVSVLHISNEALADKLINKGVTVGGEK